jgi:hypothetical protein
MNSEKSHQTAIVDGIFYVLLRGKKDESCLSILPHLLQKTPFLPYLYIIKQGDNKLIISILTQ